MFATKDTIIALKNYVPCPPGQADVFELYAKIVVLQIKKTNRE